VGYPGQLPASLALMHAALVPPVAVVVVVLVAVAAVAVVVLGLQRLDMMVLFPPCMFLMVAV